MTRRRQVLVVWVTFVVVYAIGFGNGFWVGHSSAAGSQIKVTAGLRAHADRAIESYCPAQGTAGSHYSSQRAHTAYVEGFCGQPTDVGHQEEWRNGRSDRRAADRVLTRRYVSRATATTVRSL